MTKALITKEDIKQFIFDALYQYGQNKVLNRIEMCKYFNITFYQLDKFLEQGLPWIGKPTRKKFDINECMKWFEANGQTEINRNI